MKIVSSHKSHRSAAPTRTEGPRPSSTGNVRAGADQTSISRETSERPAGLGNLLNGLESNYGGGESPEAARAARTYRQHGAQPHDLNDRRQVGQLISRTPQLDDMDGRRRVTLREASPGHAAERGRVRTDGDEARCGGAALFNSLLLDGDPSNNANALESVANQRAAAQRGQRGAFTVGDPERRAIQHMRDGSLTPREAALLQEMTYDMSRNPGQDPGLSTRQIGDTLRDLRQAGGLQHTSEVNIRGEHHGGPLGHATVSSRTDHGTHFADSWPQQNGYAQVTGQSEASFAPGDHPERNFSSSVTFRHNQGGDSERLVYRAAGGARTDAERAQEAAGTLRPLEQQCQIDSTSESGCFDTHRVYPGEMSSR